jgi:hypothetical protein
VEASRKHGPFDARWPCARKDSSAEATLSPGAAALAETLDWDAFSTLHFPERPRHDSQARSAYAAYKQGREWRVGPPGLRLVPATASRIQKRTGTRRLLAAVAAIEPTTRTEERI